MRIIKVIEYYIFNVKIIKHKRENCTGSTMHHIYCNTTVYTREESFLETCFHTALIVCTLLNAVGFRYSSDLTEIHSSESLFKKGFFDLFC